MHLRNIGRGYSRERFGGAANRMAVRTVTKHNSRRYKTRDTARIAKRERDVVEILLSQTLDFFTLEGRPPYDIRENLHRLRNLRRHHTHSGVRSIPTRAGVERPTKTLYLLSNLRGVAGLRSFGEQVGGHVSQTSQIGWIDLTTIFDQQLSRDERRFSARDDNHAQSVWQSLFDGF